MATVRIVSNRVLLPGGVTRRRGDRFVGPVELLERMVEAETAEWLEGGPDEEVAPASEPESVDDSPPPDFASASAADLAESEGLTAVDFEGVEPSGKTGYTKADVESVLAED